jgi:hypothetical protein
MKTDAIRKLNYSLPNEGESLEGAVSMQVKGMYCGIYVDQSLIIGSARENKSSRLIGLMYMPAIRWEWIFCTYASRAYLLIFWRIVYDIGHQHR